MLNLIKNEKKNIIFIGFMGAGKSLIARELSKNLSINYYDTDYEIEKKEGLSINNIFSKYGEKYFRKIEEQVCLEILKNKNCIVSLGGGSILSKKIRSVIKQNSISIYLKVENETLFRRLFNSKKRPLLKNIAGINDIKDIFEERKKYYELADFTVDNNLKKNDVIREITNYLNKL